VAVVPSESFSGILSSEAVEMMLQLAEKWCSMSARPAPRGHSRKNPAGPRANSKSSAFSAATPVMLRTMPAVALRHGVKAPKVEEKVEGALNTGSVQIPDISTQESDIDTTFNRPPARNP
jgi:hypothetical protein